MEYEKTAKKSFGAVLIYLLFVNKYIVPQTRQTYISTVLYVVPDSQVQTTNMLSNQRP